REEVLRREYSVKEFWDTNRNLLVDAWKEWEASKTNQIDFLKEELLDKELVKRVSEAWQNPESEGSVRELIEEICPGVYQFQFFDPDNIKLIRDYLDKVDEAQIPVRPPYGIVLNRKGAMLDQRSEGYLAAPSFQSLYEEMLNQYMRPIARMLFPEITGYDTQTFGFSIQYQPTKDTSIQMHTDASSVTLNINLNLPGEEFEGSEVDFLNAKTGKLSQVKFQPGKAIIHMGAIAHRAHPITRGERTNLVLWLYGEQMQVQRRFGAEANYSAKERWTKPTNKPDGFAPF
ncbi:MAG: 2OG-Fe(II) oxygenase, partial [Bdellovibrionales bacterium]|nr:hypothetical protein [Bdellovibrionales bacterium]NQZ20237.1 2OG-Fe(II) oxygenase [Bdellovibrionales bacterium]